MLNFNTVCPSINMYVMIESQGLCWNLYLFNPYTQETEKEANQLKVTVLCLVNLNGKNHNHFKGIVCFFVHTSDKE